MTNFFPIKWKKFSQSDDCSNLRKERDKSVIKKLVVGSVLFSICLSGILSKENASGEEGVTEISPGEHVTTGLEWYKQGKFEEALTEWNRANSGFKNQEKIEAEQAKLDVLKGEAYRRLGQYEAASFHFNRALEWARSVEDFRVVTQALDRLGAMAFEIGEREKSLDFLREGIQVARDHGLSSTLAGLLNSNGNVLASMDRNIGALGAYTESAGLAGATQNPELELVALINSARAAMQEGLMDNSEQRLDLALEKIDSLPHNHGKVNNLVTIGLLYNDLHSRKKVTHQEGSHAPNTSYPGSRGGERGVTIKPGTGAQILEEIVVVPERGDITLPSFSRSEKTMAKSLRLRAYGALDWARAIARQLGDIRGESYAEGYMGYLYEESGQYPEALMLTRQAVGLSQKAMATESLYRWHWQTARIHRAEGRLQQAMEAYRRAISALQSIRNEISVAYQIRRESFREGVGAVFFEFADLLLTQAQRAEDDAKKSELLVEARNVIEEFKAAELQDYFQDDCVLPSETLTQTLITASPNTAILYPILLQDRTELIVNYPSGLKQYSVSVGQRELSQQARRFRLQLQDIRNEGYQENAKQLYDRLIQPFDQDLRTEEIHTLVVVPDGALRSIPIAALYDGKKYLIEKYALATTPGLTLTDPKPLNRENMKVLSLGITKAVQGFPPLPYVEKELETVQELFAGKSLVNENFVVEGMERQLKNEDYNVVHIASHGLVERKVENTFVLAFDEKITMNRLTDLIGMFRFRKAPLELLTLSACETAAGDDRAALGLAGVAVKAGARSALATLWFIDDAVASDLVGEFYRQLQNPSRSKAQALQASQVKILENPQYRHPNFWSPFLLINNWL